MNLLLLIIMISLFACGKPPVDKTEERSLPEVRNEGTYSAVLLPVNPRITSTVSADVKILKFGDDFRVTVKLRNAPRGKFTQSINYGSICPKLVQDLDGNGYIDSYESWRSAGYVVVPLDGDLSSQESGSFISLEGNYSYFKATSYYLMLSDLHLPDDVVNDGMMKLPDNDLPLDRRVVTVSLKSESAPPILFGDVPIACGVLTKISDHEIPEEEDTSSHGTPRRGRIPPAPDPTPVPVPTPDPEPLPPPRGETWWERMRERWRQWRNRWRGGDETRLVVVVSESRRPSLSQESFQTKSSLDEV